MKVVTHSHPWVRCRPTSLTSTLVLRSYTPVEEVLQGPLPTTPRLFREGLPRSTLSENRNTSSPNDRRGSERFRLRVDYGSHSPPLPPLLNSSTHFQTVPGIRLIFFQESFCPVFKRNSKDPRFLFVLCHSRHSDFGKALNVSK